jgi:putative nucleotidyltransferase with HDIG domain
MTAGVLFSRVRHQTRELDRFTVQSITAFVRTIDAKSPYTARHSENVAAYAVAIGEEMGYHGEALRRLYWAGLLHDIGKLMVPDTILNKPGQLSPDERRIIERHPLDSVAILDGIQRFEPYLDAIRHHHERVDGRGYPDGIAGEALSLDARILAAADAFEAMTSDRPYRRGMEHGEALRRLQDGAGTHFDPDVVAGLRRALDKGALPLRGTRRWLGLAG